MPVLSLPEAVSSAKALRARGQRLVLTNGVFDLLHMGHVDYLQKARAMGDILFVGVNGDEATRQLKGPHRPFIPGDERAALVAALRCVDAAFIFEDLTADGLLESLRPDFYAKGGDYAHKPLPEYETALKVGAKIVLIDYLPEHSTTALITKLLKLDTSE